MLEKTKTYAQSLRSSGLSWAKVETALLALQNQSSESARASGLSPNAEEIYHSLFDAFVAEE